MRARASAQNGVEPVSHSFHALLVACLIALMVVAAPAAFGKDGRSYYDDELMARVHKLIEQHEWARNQVAAARNSAQWLVDMSDDELWDFIPPPEQLRALNVSFGNGCPKCGKEIFRAAGHYPWITSRDKPFKVECPVCHTVYPSNDFEPWNPESITEEPQKGPDYIDHGAGWMSEDGKRYFFVGYYVFWRRWQADVIPGVRALANAYLLTDEPIYAHKCAVMLAKIAGDWARYDYPKQAYHNGRWPAGINGRIVDYIWSNGTIGTMSLAYDAVFPALAGDAELAAYLKAKGIEDLPRHIETQMLHVMVDDLKRGFIRGNEGMHQQAMCNVAIAIDNDDPAQGPTTKEMADWVMTGAGNSEYLLWNGFYRDGHGGESSPGYSSGWCENFYQVASLLPKLGVDIWANPKLKKMADIGLDLYVGETSCPSIGDAGTIFGAGRVGWSRTMQGRAFDHYKDPRHAQALATMNAGGEDLFETYFDQDEVDAAVAQVGTQMEYKTRNLGGYGLAVLESGGPGNRRGACMYYGHAGGGHGHYDRLTIQLMSHGKPMLTDMGYPAHWLEKNTYWTSNTISHYAVLVNQKRHESMYRGFLNTLVSTPQVQLMDASADRVTYPHDTSLYRRTCALIDISPETSYLLDIFRVDGGYQHDYSFHGPPFPEFTVSGAEPGPLQAKGTLAGEDCEFGGVPSTRTVGGKGQAHVIELSKSPDLVKDDRTYGEQSLDGWARYSGSYVLTQKLNVPMTVEFPEVPAGTWKLFLQVHDYNTGSVTVSVDIGGIKKDITWAPAGQVGPMWVSEVFDLPQAAKMLTMTAKQISGQTYALVLGAAITDELGGTSPRIADIRSSGFQYLFNIRRMQPQGEWSATWRDPVDDLALTMLMPEGCTQEAILADAEPELKPGHPKTLQYVLARNALPEDAPGDDLSSTYITLSEPHRGPALTQSVSRLEAVEASHQAAGIAVRREGVRDLIHSSITPNDPCVWKTGSGDLAVTGEFGMVSVDADGVSRACLINGTKLQYGDVAIECPPSPVGTVAAVDFANNSIIIEGDLDIPQAYIDSVAILGNELQSTSYTIVDATSAGGRTTLDFGDTLFVVQMGAVDSVDSAAKTVKLLHLERVDGQLHTGRWLYNEDKSQGFRIARIGGGIATLEAGDVDLDGVFTDLDGDGRRQFWISDIGPSDTCRIPNRVFVERRTPQLYFVHTLTECQVTVPGAEVAQGE